VVAIQNTIAGWKLGIAKVIVKNNGVWHTNLVVPITLLGVKVPKMELDNLVVIIDPLLGLDASIEVQTMSINTKDYGRQTQHWASTR
jgi:hypothetical protein